MEISNYPSFLGSSGSPRDEHVRKKQGSKNGSNTISAQTEMGSIVETIADAKLDASKVLSNYCMKMNSNGETNIGKISKGIDNVMVSFSDADKVEILTGALARVIANL